MTMCNLCRKVELSRREGLVGILCEACSDPARRNPVNAALIRYAYSQALKCHRLRTLTREAPPDHVIGAMHRGYSALREEIERVRKRDAAGPGEAVVGPDLFESLGDVANRVIARGRRRGP